MTQSNLTHLRQVAQVPTEIIVIDNGSPCKGEIPADLFVPRASNLGIAPAWNSGTVVATFDHFVFLNNDCRVSEGWDVSLLKHIDGRVVFPMTDHNDGRGYRPGDGGVSGWCFGMTRSTFDKVGEFDETFSPAYYEDTDWFHRAWNLNIPLVHVADAKVWHQRRTTAMNADWASRANQLFNAHRLKYAWKHGCDPSLPPPFYTNPTIV